MPLKQLRIPHHPRGQMLSGACNLEAEFESREAGVAKTETQRLPASILQNPAGCPQVLRDLRARSAASAVPRVAAQRPLGSPRARWVSALLPGDGRARWEKLPSTRIAAPLLGS